MSISCSLVARSITWRVSKAGAPFFAEVFVEEPIDTNETHLVLKKQLFLCCRQNKFGRSFEPRNQDFFGHPHFISLDQPERLRHFLLDFMDVPRHPCCHQVLKPRERLQVSDPDNESRIQVLMSGSLSHVSISNR